MGSVGSEFVAGEEVGVVISSSSSDVSAFEWLWSVKIISSPQASPRYPEKGNVASKPAGVDLGMGGMSARQGEEG